VASVSCARYATSTKNITGCALALAGPALAVAGVLAPPVALALVLPLYAVGALVAPARRHVEVVAGVDAREVQRSLRDVQCRALPPVPREILLKIKRITMTITELLPRAGALGAGSPDQYVLVKCATDYLPTAFQSYLDLPRDYADHCAVADGKTPLALLSEQLDLLTTQIDRIADRVNGVHSDKLIANGRFLSQKFRPGALDLDADAGRKRAENDLTTTPSKCSKKEDRHENTKPQLVSALTEPMTSTAFAQHARTVVAHHGERILAEIPTTLRRIGLLFLVVAISIPAFLAALIVVLWHLGS
jgi:hypothetical protein